MFRHSNSNSKLIGILGILLGLLCFGSFFIIDTSKLIIPGSTFFLAQYFIIILLVNCGIYLIIFGALNFVGVLVPYYSEGITKYEKARHHLLAAIVSLPVWISLLSLVFIAAESIIWKILGSLAGLYVVWLFYSSIRVLKKQVRAT